MLNLKSPLSIIWETTNACNFSCPHCRSYEENPTIDESIEKEIVKQVIDAEVLNINLSGGESLIHPRITELVSVFSQNGLNVELTTNGWNYQDKANDLQNAGLNCVLISLDGPQNIHDSFRDRQGSFQRAFDSLVRAKELGHITQMNITITSQNMNSLFETIKIGEKIGVDRVFIRRLIPTGLAKENSYLQLNRDNYIKILKKLAKYEKKSKTLISIDDPIYPLIKYNSVDADSLNCVAGITSLGIDSKGNIYPCLFLRENIGNIMTHNLKELWKKSDILTKLRNREINICGECKYKNSCGGCRAYSGIFEHDKMCPIYQT